ncbi:MAG TPA: nucleotide sugar dehydrogenase [Chlamydiales bacterium]|nr:nucleotide sugar dehydrogenase [Chlamydiales bacterium]
MEHYKIGIVGLWHLGCVLVASWLKLGNEVIGVDFEPDLIGQLRKGKAPLYEPNLDETIAQSIKDLKVSFSTDSASLKNCDYIFLSYDTPVDDNDHYDLTILEKAIEKIAPHLKANSTLIISSQVPVGTSQQFAKKLQNTTPSIEVVYSPENLRLGEAISNYLNPGHIVIGADNQKAANAANKLFSAIEANYLHMNLASAEMTKHAINSFLATSITFANQLADVCSLSGADFHLVAQAMKQDHRIGKKAYLKAGIGFSGGTLGRDLQILHLLNQMKGNGSFPIFGNTWQYNRERPFLIIEKISAILGSLKNKTISILGMTYKPGTSTLRRSIPLEMAHTLVKKGAKVKVYDPKANWAEADLQGIQIVDNPNLIAQGSHFLLLLTEWQEFKSLNYNDLAKTMKEKKFFDPYSFLDSQHSLLQSFGYKIFTINTLMS